ncbi:MAG: cytochrome P450 [Flavobacteriaceae bacterium]|jgi:cytochrome P450
MKLPPQPKGAPIMGHLKQFKNDPIKFMLESSEEFGDIMLFKIFRKKIYFINDPALIKHVLQDNHKNYIKSTGYKPMRLIVGNGMLTSDGESWVRSRKFSQSAFNNTAIRSYVGAVNENAERLVADWKSIAENEGEINASHEMAKITLAVIGETLFSTRIDYGTELSNNINYVLEYAGERALRNPFVFPANWPTAKNKKFIKAKAELDELIYGIIESKRNSNDTEGDTLSRLMNHTEESGDGLSDQELRDEVMTIFLAGHETTSNTMSWALYCIGINPEIQEKIYAETQKLEGAKIDYEDLHDLVYTTQVISETMRLYPAAWHMGRMNLEADKLGDYELPAGSHVRISALALHRRSEFWTSPLEFNPDRFHPSKAKDQQPYCFIPFGGGPRLCVGRNFAMMEMVILLATIVKNYKISYTGPAPEMAPNITLATKKSVKINIIRR